MHMQVRVKLSGDTTIRLVLYSNVLCSNVIVMLLVIIAIACMGVDIIFKGCVWGEGGGRGLIMMIANWCKDAKFFNTSLN